MLYGQLQTGCEKYYLISFSVITPNKIGNTLPNLYVIDKIQFKQSSKVVFSEDGEKIKERFRM